MRLALVCFYCLCVFVYVLYFIATMPFAGYFLPVLFCMLSMLISDSRFDLVWFRLSCDHGWIRSGSVNVRKQQQQQQRTTRPFAAPTEGPCMSHAINDQHDTSRSKCARCMQSQAVMLAGNTPLRPDYCRAARSGFASSAAPAPSSKALVRSHRLRTRPA